MAKSILRLKLSRPTVRASEKGRAIAQAGTGKESADVYVITPVTAGLRTDAAAYAGADGGSVGSSMLPYADHS